MAFEGSSSEIRRSAADYDSHVLSELPKDSDKQRNQNDRNADAESYCRSEHPLLGEKSYFRTTVQETRPVPWHGLWQSEGKTRGSTHDVGT